MISVEGRDVAGVNFRAEWPRETCTASGVRAASGAVIGLRGEERATILAQGEAKEYKAVTGAGGKWEILNMEPGVYTVTAQCATYVLTPGSIHANLTDRSLSDLNFRAIRK